MGASVKNGTLPGWILRIESKKGKREAYNQKMDELLTLHPELSLNGGVICGSLKILIKALLIERNWKSEIVYLDFEGFGLGWGSLVLLT